MKAEIQHHGLRIIKMKGDRPAMQSSTRPPFLLGRNFCLIGAGAFAIFCASIVGLGTTMSLWIRAGSPHREFFFNGLMVILPLGVAGMVFLGSRCLFSSSRRSIGSSKSVAPPDATASFEGETPSTLWDRELDG